MPYSLQIIILCAVPLHHSHLPFAHWAEQYTIALLFYKTTSTMTAGPQLWLLGGNATTHYCYSSCYHYNTMLYALCLAHVQVSLCKPVKSWWDIKPVPLPPSSNPTSSQKRLELEWHWNNEITVPSVYINLQRVCLGPFFVCLWEHSKHLITVRKAGNPKWWSFTPSSDKKPPKVLLFSNFIFMLVISKIQDLTALAIASSLYRCVFRKYRSYRSQVPKLTQILFPINCGFCLLQERQLCTHHPKYLLRSRRISDKSDLFSAQHIESYNRDYFAHRICI